MNSPAKDRFTILAVDDMPENLALLGDILGQDYRLLAARDGERALQLARSQPAPDLILLDLMMPGMDGYSVCTELKADPRTAQIPVIFVTARNEQRDELRGFVVGAVDFITKPVSPPLLRARIQTQLQLASLTRSLQQRVDARTRELELQIRERDAAMARAEYLSLHDPLTGLPNLRQLRARAEQMLEHVNEGMRLGILHFNLDRLGLIHHNLGASHADGVINEVASRLRAAAGVDDFVARDAGDNFILLLGLRGGNSKTTRRKIALLADNLRKSVSLNTAQLITTASVGTAMLPEDASSVDGGLACARAALRAAKAEGPNTTKAYEPQYGQTAKREHRLELQLQSALQQHALEIHFQPQVELATGRINGAEVLIRWPDGSGGYISNGSFLPVAEHAGLMLALDKEVLSQSLRWLGEHKQAFAPGIRLAINLSAQGLLQPGWLERVPALLEEAEVPPQLLELEITEQNLIRNMSDTGRRLRALAESGIRIASDDFGSGYSSLAWLESLPIDRVKLDRQFIRRLRDSPRAATVASAMIRLTSELGLDCVIEGIENEAQKDFASQHGAPTGQGFFLYRPMPGTRFLELLAAQDQS